MKGASAISMALLRVLKTKLAGVRTLFKQREEIYQNAQEGRQFNFLYFAMLLFACLIALLGLLLNSPAVIIGAMLISPLMGPILCCGLALTLADWDLGRKAGKNALLSVIEVIFIVALATTLSPLKEATPEILARTAPNLMDLLIAFFSGLAGTLALASRKGGLSILPGVAIATAVMPPLATVGYGLSTRQWSVAGGAFMLFLTNFTAIVISADLVFLLIGFRPRQVHAEGEHAVLVKWRIAIASVVLAALSIPLMRTLLRAAQQARARNEISTVLHAQFDRPGDRRLSSIDIKSGQDPILVDSVVQTERFIEPQEIDAAESAVSAKLKVPVRLIIEQVQLAHQSAPQSGTTTEGNDFVAGGVVRTAGMRERTESVSENISRLQDRVNAGLEPLSRPTGVQNLKVNGISVEDGGKLRIELSGRQDNLADVQAWRVVSVALGKDLRAPVRIIATLELDGAGINDVHFRKNSAQLSSTEVRKALRFLATWRGKPGIQGALFVPTTPGSDLAERRVLSLKRRLRAEDITTVRPDPSLARNIIRLQAVQVLNVDETGTDSPKSN